MGRRKRGLFHTDLGDHPPEIQEFLEEWHHRDHRHWMSHGISSAFGRPSSEEVRQNARWFGNYLLLVAVVVPGGIWWWAGGRLSTVARAGWIVFAVCFAVLGVALLRSARRPTREDVVTLDAAGVVAASTRIRRRTRLARRSQSALTRR
jgi:hypothetical protein